MILCGIASSFSRAQGSLRLSHRGGWCLPPKLLIKARRGPCHGICKTVMDAPVRPNRKNWEGFLPLFFLLRAGVSLCSGLSFQQLASSILAKPMPSCRNSRAGGGCPRVRAECRAWGGSVSTKFMFSRLPLTGKQTSEHSLLSRCFHAGVSKSLLSRSIP